MSKRKALNFLSRGGIDHDQLAGVEIRDQNQLAIGRELQAVGAARLEIDGLHNFLLCDIDDRDGTVAGVRRPQLATVRRNIVALGTLAHRNHGLIPRQWILISPWTRSTLKDRDGIGADVGGEHAVSFPAHDDHVRGVLAGAKEPIDLVGGWIISGDELVQLRREVNLTAKFGDPVWAAQRAKINLAGIVRG